MKQEIEWLEPWDSLCTDSNYFEEELYKEVSEGHILYGKKVSAIGRRYDKDDFLFLIDDLNFSIAVVHLTFSPNRENSSNFPITKVFRNLEDWIKDCMKPDHEDFI